MLRTRRSTRHRQKISLPKKKNNTTNLAYGIHMEELSFSDFLKLLFTSTLWKSTHLSKASPKKTTFVLRVVWQTSAQSVNPPRWAALKRWFLLFLKSNLRETYGNVVTKRCPLFFLFFEIGKAWSTLWLMAQSFHQTWSATLPGLPLFLVVFQHRDLNPYWHTSAVVGNKRSCTKTMESKYLHYFFCMVWCNEQTCFLDKKTLVYQAAVCAKGVPHLGATQHFLSFPVSFCRNFRSSSC